MARLHRTLAAALAVLWGFFFFGLTDLLAFAQGPDFHRTLLLSTGWGLLFLFLVAAPLLALVVRPAAATPAALGLVVAVAVAVATASAVSGSAGHLVVAAALAVTTAVLAATGGGLRAWPSYWRPSLLPAALVVLAAAPAFAYSWNSARATGTNLVADDTWGLDHWPIQAALPIALLLGATLAAGHPQGWRVPTWCVGTATVWLAVVSWFEPDLAGSIGRTWAAVAVLWAVCFVVAVQVSRPAIFGAAQVPPLKRVGR